MISGSSSGGAQVSTSTSSNGVVGSKGGAPGYNQILRGLPRDSGALHSASINKGGLALAGGAHEKMLSKASNN